MERSGFRLKGRYVALALIGLVAVILVIGGVRLFSPSRAPERVETVFSYPETPPEGKLPGGVRPLHYALDLRIIPQEDYFSGTASIEVEVDLHTRFIWLHGRDLNVSRVEVRQSNGNVLEATWEQLTEGGVARISFEEALKPGTIMLQIEYDAHYSENPEGLYKILSDGKPMVFSQFQAIDARRAFPSFDEPRFKVPFDISIIAPDSDQVITNAPRIDLMQVGAGERLHLFETSAPLPTAIVSFSVGDLEVVDGGTVPPSALRDSPIPLRAFARKGHGSEMQAMLEATAPLILSMESWFGQAYPYKKLDLIAVPDFTWAGMENASAISYREDFIFVNEQTTAKAYNDVVETHAHELAHQWFGNLVTPEWWDDIWLSESFASWFAGKMIAKWDPDLGADDFVKRSAHYVMKQDGRPSAPRVYQPVQDNEDIMNSFSDIAYYKGGGVLEMFEAYVGEEDFREGVALFMKRHKGGTATLDDFTDAISIGSGHPEIASAFRSFVMQPGLPIVETAINCTGSIKEISFMQSRYYPLGTPAQDESFQEIPICYRTDEQSGCHLLTEKQETVRLGKTCPSYVMPNKDASGYYLWSLDDAALANLKDHLTDLTPIESEALAWNLAFWFGSDRISAPDTLDLVKALAQLDRPRTDLALLDTLSGFRPYLVLKEDRETFNVWINALYGPRAKTLGFNPGSGEAVGRSLLRDALTNLLVGETAEREIRLRLERVLDAQKLSIRRGLPKGDAIFDHNRAEAILLLGVMEVGKPFTDSLFELISTGEAGRRDHMILRALARTENKGLGRRLMDDFLLTNTLRSESVFTLAQGLARNPEQIEGFWTWVGRSDNLAKLLARVPESSHYELVHYGASICDEGHRDLFEAVIGAHLPEIAGGTAGYAQTLEAIDQCLAIAKAKGVALAVALQ